MMSDQEQVTAMAYRDGRLTEIDPNGDLFLKRLIEEDLKASKSEEDGSITDYLRRMDFDLHDEFGDERFNPHAVWRHRNKKKYLIVLCDTDEPIAFVKIESLIEYMDFARDYLVPLINLESRSVAFLPEE
jgi:hypothetical protein